jgi:hypothetical protein
MDIISLVVGALVVVIPLIVYVLAKHYQEFSQLKKELRYLKKDYEYFSTQRIENIYQDMDRIETDLYKAIEESRSNTN